jgi:hypothetical protein
MPFSKRISLVLLSGNAFFGTEFEDILNHPVKRSYRNEERLQNPFGYNGMPEFPECGRSVL